MVRSQGSDLLVRALRLPRSVVTNRLESLLRHRLYKQVSQVICRLLDLRVYDWYQQFVDVLIYLLFIDSGTLGKRRNTDLQVRQAEAHLGLNLP